MQRHWRLCVQSEQRTIHFNRPPAPYLQIDTGSRCAGRTGKFGNPRQTTIVDFDDASSSAGRDHMGVRRDRRLAKTALRCADRMEFSQRQTRIELRCSANMAATLGHGLAKLQQGAGV